MPDRMFFLLTPKEPRPLTEERVVNTVAGSAKTLELINKACGPSVFKMADDVREYACEEGKKLGDPRAMNMVYKFALYFATDLGLSEITEDCVTRAIALVEYRQRAMEYLQPIEAKNDEGRLLKEMLRLLRQHGGKMTRREFNQLMHPEDYGLRFWNMVYKIAIQENWIREFTEQGKRGQTRKMIGLVKQSVRDGPRDYDE